MPAPDQPDPKTSQRTEDPPSDVQDCEEPLVPQPRLPKLDAMTRFLPRELLGLPSQKAAEGAEAT